MLPFRKISKTALRTAIMTAIITTILGASVQLTLAAGAARAAEPFTPTDKDKCAVCGMFVKSYEKWVSQIVFKDGTYAFFDGPKDMFKYYLDIPKYNKGKSKNDVEEVYVTEYYSARVVRAKDVVFVTGSDAVGPMGKEIVPVKPESAETFLKDHKGHKTLKFDEVTIADIPSMKMMH
jgi:nitrous oxide reductase accessory protein NosL